MSSINISEVLQQELAQVETSRNLRLGHNLQRPAAQKSLIGLAFSGGGIRSAIFNLGVIQALAQARILHKFDYVSTVSGGGYIGSWLMAWMHHQRIGIKEIEKQLGSRSYSTTNAADPPEVRFLRNYSIYLTPQEAASKDRSSRGGYEASALPPIRVGLWGTRLRNAILKQLILLLFLGSLFLLPRVLVYLPNRLEALENATSVPGLAQIAAVQLAFLLAMSAIFFIGMNLVSIDSRSNRRFPWYAKQWGIQLVIVIPLILAAALFSYGIAYGIFNDQVLSDPLLDPPLMGMYLYFGLWLGAFLIRRAVRRNLIQAKLNVRPTVTLVLTTAIVTGAIAGYLFLPFGKFLTPPPFDDYFNWHIFAFGTPIFVLIMLFSGTLHIGLMGRDISQGHRRWLERLAGHLVIYALGWLLLFVIAIYTPCYLARVWGARLTSVQSAGGWAGLISMAYGFLFGKTGKDFGLKDTSTSAIKRLPEHIKKLNQYVVPLSACVYGAVLALGSSLLVDKASRILVNDPNSAANLPFPFSGPEILTTSFLTLCTGLLFAWRVDINEFSIDYTYRDWLVRGYLGASVLNRREQPFTGVADADDLPLSDLQIPTESTELKDARPLQILNTSLNVDRGKVRSFSFTPLYAGFTREALGGTQWQSVYGKTSDLGSRQIGSEMGLSLGTAVAISSAVASRNATSLSQRALSFFLTLVDARLGWWIGNPINSQNWRVGSPRVGFFWLLRELLGSTNDDSGFVYLSDGGHFENLAIYELVRRGCKLIVVGDASCDPSAGFGCLHNAIERCRVDFGVEIVLYPSSTLRQNGLAQSHFAVGTIHYSSSTEDNGTIIYLKPTIVAGDPAEIIGYAASNSSFPDCTSTNQLFDDAHFENYRALGEITGIAAVRTICEAILRLGITG